MLDSMLFRCCVGLQYNYKGSESYADAVQSSNKQGVIFLEISSIYRERDSVHSQHPVKLDILFIHSLNPNKQK